MSCVSPLKAYWRSRHRDAITFDIAKSATKIPFALPCGRCVGCRMEKARQWGLRCVHESKLWSSSLFVTLTYNDEFLPPAGSLQVTDVQRFLKRLRIARQRWKKGEMLSQGDSWINPQTGRLERPVRFFMGAEYGEENRRPHYHALLFNVGFSDLKRIGVNARGEPLYSSERLSRLWSENDREMGYCTVGAVTFDSAVYCAKYAFKKLSVSENSSEEARRAFLDRYEVYDENGECFTRKQEFATMSRQPGIGAGYYEKYGDEVRAHDSIVINGMEVRPPRYYDTRSERVDADGLARMKRRRKRMAVLNKSDNTPERLRVKQRLMEIAAEKKERKL